MSCDGREVKIILLCKIVISSNEFISYPKRYSVLTWYLFHCIFTNTVPFAQDLKLYFVSKEKGSRYCTPYLKILANSTSTPRNLKINKS